MNNIPVSQLSSISSIDNNDLLLISEYNNGLYDSKKINVQNFISSLGEKIDIEKIISSKISVDISSIIPSIEELSNSLSSTDKSLVKLGNCLLSFRTESTNRINGLSSDLINLSSKINDISSIEDDRYTELKTGEESLSSDLRSVKLWYDSDSDLIKISSDLINSGFHRDDILKDILESNLLEKVELSKDGTHIIFYFHVRDSQTSRQIEIPLSSMGTLYNYKDGVKLVPSIEQGIPPSIVLDENYLHGILSDENRTWYIKNQTTDDLTVSNRLIAHGNSTIDNFSSNHGDISSLDVTSLNVKSSAGMFNAGISNLTVDIAAIHSFDGSHFADETTNGIISSSTYNRIFENSEKINTLSLDLSGLSSFTVEEINILDNKIDTISSFLSNEISGNYKELTSIISSISSSLDTKIDKTKTDLTNTISSISSILSNEISGSSKDITDHVNNKNDPHDTISHLSGAISTVTGSNLISNRVVITNSNGKLSNSVISVTTLNHISALNQDIPSDAKFTDTTYTGEKGISVSNTKIGHINNITPLSSTSLKKIAYDSYGHVTSTSNVVSSDIVSTLGYTPADKETGGGDVYGPVSSLNNHIVIFDGQTGKHIKDSGFTIGRSVPSDAKITTSEISTALNISQYAKSSTLGDLAYQNLSAIIGTNISISDNKLSAKDTTYDEARSNMLGLIKIGYTQNNKNYPVQLSNGQAYVNVPWIGGSASDVNVDGITIGKKGQSDNYQIYVKSISTLSGDLTGTMASKDFVNSSIATNTAYFKGTYSSYDSLTSSVNDATPNDYAFITDTNLSGLISAYNRYKYTVNGNISSWVYEYTLNNSSFTQEQWDTINSNVTSSDKQNWDDTYNKVKDIDLQNLQNQIIYLTNYIASISSLINSISSDSFIKITE